MRTEDGSHKLPFTKTILHSEDITGHLCFNILLYRIEYPKKFSIKIGQKSHEQYLYVTLFCAEMRHFGDGFA